MKKYEIKNINCFELEHIFDCGQCFRWRKEDDGSYTGVINKGVINVKKDDKKIAFCGEVDGDLEDVCKEYFDLDRDYLEIQNKLGEDDKYLKAAIAYGYGIRILNQDSWELLISFIISAANNIPRISKTIERISMKYGKEIEFNGNKYYLFPTPDELSNASIEDLRALGLGFRDKYIYEATKFVRDGKIDLDKIRLQEKDIAKKELIKIPGVGPKVADCILLFSMKKMNAFPVDTWIKKAISEIYMDSDNVTKINKFAETKFGQYSGIAQQYIFYYRRNN